MEELDRGWSQLRIMKRVLLTVFFIFLLPTRSTTQTPNGSVEGTVIRSDTNEPIIAAQVTIRNAYGAENFPFPIQILVSPLVSILTDDQGRFSFSNLAAGDYVVMSEDDGFSNLGGGPGVPRRYSRYAERITVRSGQITVRVALSLVPLAKVAGSVRDSSGQRVPGIEVSIGNIEYENGRRTWGSRARTVTDERGEFSFSKLKPDAYYIAVSDPAYSNSRNPQNEKVGPYYPTFYPSALTIESAEIINLNNGDEFRADVTMRTKPVGLKSISGRVLNGMVPNTPRQDGGPILEGVTLVPRIHDPVLQLPMAQTWTAPLGPSREFRIDDVPPGEYDLYASSWHGFQTYYGHFPFVMADRDLSNLSFEFDQKSVDVVSGRIFDESGTQYPNDRPVLRSMAPMYQEDKSSEPNTRGSLAFEFHWVQPGIYDLAHIDLPNDAYIADIRQDGRSVLEAGIIVGNSTPSSPIDVMIRHGGGTVRVLVQGDRGRSGLLVLLPDPYQYQSQTVHPSINVTVPMVMPFENVRPGNYKLYALESWLYEPYQNAYLNVEFLSKYAEFGVPVTVKDGETTTVPVTLLAK